MSAEFDFSTGVPSQEMAQYLQMYLDETSEQMDALVESLLELESRPTDAEQLNESFRLIHSIKGSSAMMGLSGVTVLAHHLENHFERLRSGLQQLDQTSLGLILRCIDFLRECNRRLRVGQALGSAPELLDELNALSSSGGPMQGAAVETPAVAIRQTHPASQPAIADGPSTPADETSASLAQTSGTSSPVRDFRVLVQFEAELALAGLKAELVLTRLSAIAVIRDTRPERTAIEDAAEIRCLEVLLSADCSPAELRAAADVDGIELIEIDEGATAFAGADVAATAEAQLETRAAIPPVSPSISREAEDQAVQPSAGGSIPAAAAAEMHGAKPQTVETVRVDLARLDNLMNLVGELVVNKARFVQIARQMSPAFKQSSLTGRARAFGESLHRAIQLMKSQAGNGAAESSANWSKRFRDLESEIAALEEQSKLWEEGRRGFAQITEAIDQMARVSGNLQRGVLDTRMVPIAPLFNRFKRVVRDIALELGKKVHLEIRGEKTELDKRMIDELGDPLVHLVRNAIDHGIEPVDVRVRRGKPEAGTICLEASHSGNNVFISVRDDGGGVHVEKVRQRIIERKMLPEDAAAALSDREVLEHIWHPGFSTADAVSDISGRGVGMDIVKTRIAALSGTIEVEHAAGRGTTFTVRLPLTLAIIRSLLFRVRHGTFAVPIDSVREIVSVPPDQVVTVHGRRTIDVRGRFIPLVDIDEIFDWHSVNDQLLKDEASDTAPRRINVLVLQSTNKTMGLRVDDLHGAQEIVIKSLAENFVHIRGLSGASILGDGSVCLLLDAAAVIDMVAGTRGRHARPERACVPAL